MLQSGESSQEVKTGPFLEIGESVKISINEIPNGGSRPVKMGDRVIVYWWTDDYKDHSDIKGEAIVI